MSIRSKTCDNNMLKMPNSSHHEATTVAIARLPTVLTELCTENIDASIRTSLGSWPCVAQRLRRQWTLTVPVDCIASNNLTAKWHC